MTDEHVQHDRESEPGTDHSGGEHSRFQAHHFDTAKQQFEAGKLGIWLFLVTEILFFGGLFCAYAVYRANHPEIFIAGAMYLNEYLGAANTCVLLFSSLTMAWGVRCAQLGHQRGLIVCLVITLLCAFTFLGIKYVEYEHKWHQGLLWAGWFDPDAHGEEAADAEHLHEEEKAHGLPEGSTPEHLGVFFSIYFAMTGLHGLHVIGGIIAISWLLVRARKGHFTTEYFGPVDSVGLYWHLVDLIWIYLFPLLYLID